MAVMEGVSIAEKDVSGGAGHKTGLGVITTFVKSIRRIRVSRLKYSWVWRYLYQKKSKTFLIF